MEAAGAQAQAVKEQKSPFSQHSTCFRHYNKCPDLEGHWNDEGLQAELNPWKRGLAAAPQVPSAETRFPA